MSAPPPAGKGTITRTGLDGYACPVPDEVTCATAGGVTAAVKAAQRVRRKLRVIVLLDGPLYLLLSFAEAREIQAGPARSALHDK